MLGAALSFFGSLAGALSPGAPDGSSSVSSGGGGRSAATGATGPQAPPHVPARHYFGQRYEWMWFDLLPAAGAATGGDPRPTRYTALRLDVHAVRAPGDGAQLAKWHVRVE